MAVTCPDCGADVAPGAKFCPACGARQPEPAASSREVRKVVTVLFADVTGSTALGEQLDPEALRGLMTRYFTRMRSVIEAHGGTVEKFIGDAVMAVFGIPTVHEDDALRAVRAAAEIRDALAAMNEELEAERGIAIRFRTGVNTGEVVAGDPASDTTLVTGDTVNTAARLEQAAPPGEILLGKLTWSLVRDAVDAVPVDPVQAKGKAEPLEAWRLIAVRAGAEGRTRHLDAPLVGRDRELTALDDAWRRAVDERTPHLVTIVAPAGVGKSRLVREFIERVRADGGQALVGRCLSYGEGITYWPVRELVHQAAGITEADDAAAARSKLDALMGSAIDGDRAAARIAAAIGLAPGGVAQEELFWAVRRLLEQLAEAQPTLVVFEDLHWAEEPLLDLLDYLADLTTGVPLLIVATARPDLAERRPAFTAARDAGSVLRLEPLAGHAAAQLLLALPGGLAIPDDLRARILAAAEGTPLYVEELVAMLRDEGYLEPADDGWIAARPADTVVIPPTIQALLAARLEGLPERERAVATRASVLGRSFEVAALAEVDPARSTDLGRSLLALVRKELLRPDRAELTAGDAFRFRHVLIRDAAYEALPKAERAALHERFADWLERSAGDRIAELQEILAFHLGEAHRYRVELGEPDVGRLAGRAGAAFLAAGRTAYARENIRAAFAALSRAVDLVPPGRPLGDALALRFRVAGHLQEATARIGSADRLARLAEELGDEGLAQQATVAKLHIAMDSDPDLDWPATAPILERLAPEFGRRGEYEWQSDALRLAGVIVSMNGDEAAHLVLGRAAVEAARKTGWPVVLARSKTHVMGSLADGVTPVGEAIDEIESMTDGMASRTERAYAAGVLAILEATRDRPSAAERWLREQADLMHSLGRDDVSVEAGMVALALGSWAAAVEQFERVDAILGEDDARMRAGMAAFRAQALVELGDLDGALAAAVVAERHTSDTDVMVACRSAWVRGRALAARGDPVQARALAEAAVALAKGTGWPELQGESALSLARTYAAIGLLTDAAMAAAEAAAVFEAKEHLAGLRRVEAFRVELRGRAQRDRS